MKEREGEAEREREIKEGKREKTNDSNCEWKEYNRFLTCSMLLSRMGQDRCCARRTMSGASPKYNNHISCGFCTKNTHLHTHTHTHGHTHTYTQTHTQEYKTHRGQSAKKKKKKNLDRTFWTISLLWKNIFSEFSEVRRKVLPDVFDSLPFITEPKISFNIKLKISLLLW